MSAKVDENWPFRVLPPPKRRPIAGWLLYAGGWVPFFGGVLIPVFITITFILFIEELSRNGEFHSAPLFALVFLGAALLFALLISLASIAASAYGLRMVERGRRMKAWDAATILKRDKRPPVLYLRSFGDDDVYDPTPHHSIIRPRYEEELARAFRPLGPVISIGKPGEELTQVGTARLYVQDDDWRRAVEYFFGRAAAIVIMVGKSEGIWWEIITAAQRVRPERLLFFFPYVESVEARQSLWRNYYVTLFRHGNPTTGKQRPIMETERQERYAIFRQKTRDILAHGLPEAIGDAQFLDFDVSGAPRLFQNIGLSITASLMVRGLWKRSKMDIDFTRTLLPFVQKLQRAA